MTPKEKAMELFEQFYNYPDLHEFEAKQCAIICVDEIIKSIPNLISQNGYGSALFKNPDIPFWKIVKQELELL